MNNNEAKFLLRAYRPGGRDAADPAFGAALAQARQDPALGSWFAREQAFDTAVAGRLRDVAPPAGLREAILAGARASRAPQVPQRWPVWMALAAGLVLLLGLAATWRLRTAPRMDPLMAFAVNDTRFEKHGGHGEMAFALQRLLSDPATHLAANLPVDLEKLHSTGCRTVSFAGHDVMEICFSRGGRDFHIYMASRGDFPEAAEMSGPSIAQQDGWSAMQWTDASHVYVVATSADPAALRALL
jgi:hypothetical protein